MLSSLAYIGFETPALDDWHEFGTQVLGAKLLSDQTDSASASTIELNAS